MPASLCSCSWLRAFLRSSSLLLQGGCRFHEGPPVFHDGGKEWGCCKARRRCIMTCPRRTEGLKLRVVSGQLRQTLSPSLRPAFCGNRCAATTSAPSCLFLGARAGSTHRRNQRRFSSRLLPQQLRRCVWHPISARRFAYRPGCEPRRVRSTPTRLKSAIGCSDPDQDCPAAGRRHRWGRELQPLPPGVLSGGASSLLLKNTPRWALMTACACGAYWCAGLLLQRPSERAEGGAEACATGARRRSASPQEREGFGCRIAGE